MTGVGISGCLAKDGVAPEYLDIGGGMGIIYKDEQPQTAQDFADAVLPYLQKTGLKDCHGAGSIYRRERRDPGHESPIFKDNGFQEISDR